jgi:hypothetical protein
VAGTASPRPLQYDLYIAQGPQKSQPHPTGLYNLRCSQFRVADPHSCNLDPDPAFHFNAGPDPGPAFHFNDDPDLAFHFNANPDPDPS